MDNFENIPYNAQNNADKSPNINPPNDHGRAEVLSKTPLTRIQPNIAKAKQNNFLGVIFSLKSIEDIIIANIGARLNRTAASESVRLNAASL